MKKLLLASLFLCFQIIVFGQNDDCANAETLTDGNLATENTTVAATVEATEMDNTVNMGCAGAESSVWFSYTATAHEKLSIDFTNIDIPGGATPTINVLDGCLNGNLLDGQNAFTTLDDICLLNGQTIFIQISTCDDQTGAFNLVVNATTTANYDPCGDLSAHDLTGGVSFNHSNQCAGPNLTFPNCAAGDQEAAVFYNFTITDPEYGMNIIIEKDNANGNGISGTIVIALSVVDEDFCTGNTFIENECESIEFSEFAFKCLEPGTYQVQISSSTANSGDYIITSLPLENTTACTQAANSDDCINAEDINWTETCSEFNVMGCNVDACPEDFTLGGCDFSADPVVWYTFTVTANTTNIDITNFQGSTGGEYLAVFTTDCISLPTAITNCLMPGADELNIPIDPTVSLVYYIAVGNTTPEGGNFDFDLSVNEPPVNDDPCPTDLNPPMDLSGGGSHAGTTCCAIGFADDNTADYPNNECSGASHDGAVWYSYVWDDASDGVDIDVSGGSISGPVTIEVLIGGPNAGCDGSWTFETASCEPLPAHIEIAGCMDVGQVIWVKVASSDDNCGTFNIDMTPATKSCNVAETCEDLMGPSVNPETDPTFSSIIYDCTTGCLDYSCPEDPAPAPGCDFANNGTVWMQVETDDIAAQLFTTVTTGGSWTPMWSVFMGDDCGSLTNVAQGNTPPCSLDDTSPDLQQTGVQTDVDGNTITTYYVAISADPNGLPVDDPTFEFCAATIINVLVCLGDITDNCNPDPSTQVEVVDREFADGDLDPDGDGLPGPFCPGEEINLHIEFFYDASESGADWFIGLVPTFGNGWDLDAVDFDAIAPAGSSGWFDENGGCAPTIEEDVPHLCTYVDENGRLKLCNSLCEACNDCPQSGMQAGDPLPSGYFWLSNGGSAGCLNDCSPGEAWGIGSNTSQISWDFTLTVKEFDSEQDCLDNNDLQISFQTFSDGGAGCWDDPVGECLIDRKQLGTNWKVQCDLPPAVIATPNPQEICTGQEVGVTVETDDGSAHTIYVTYDDNPIVTGENDHEFDGGSGVIDDVLINTSSSPEDVIYYAHVEIPGNPCPGPVEEIVVTVYPELIVEFDEIEICYNELVTISPNVFGGKGPYDYIWNTGSTDSYININLTEDTEFCVTVSDELCEGEACVTVIVSPEFTVAITPDPVNVCQSDGGEFTLEVDITGGLPDYQYYWEFPGGIETTNGYTDEVLILDVANCDINPAGWQVTVTVTDDFGCDAEYTTVVYINDGPIIDLELIAPECTIIGDPITINVNSTPGVSGGSVTDVIIYDCDNNEIANGFGASFTHNLLALDCAEYTVVVSDINGCKTTETLNVNLGNVVPPELSINPMEVCVGETATITLNNASVYTNQVWGDASTGTSLNVSSSTAGTFTFDITVYNGPCSTTGSIELIVHDDPVINWSGSTSICAGSSTIIDAGGDETTWSYDWQHPLGTTVGSNKTITITAAGDYHLFIIDENGCTAESIITIEVSDNLSPNISGENICDDGTATLDAGLGFTTYEWIDMSDNSNIGSTQTIDVTAAGSYIVNVSLDGCSGSDTFLVEQFLTPVITGPETITVCNIDNGIGITCVNFNTVFGGADGTWTNDDGIGGVTMLDDLSNVCFVGLPEGNYTFTKTSTTAEIPPCANISKSLVINVIACDCPNIDVQDPAPICNALDTIFLDTEAKVTPEPGSWEVLSGPSGQDISSIIVDGNLFISTGIVGGTYDVLFKLDNPVLGCDSTNMVTITVHEQEVLVVDAVTACNKAGQSYLVVHDLNTYVGGASGTWSFSSNPGSLTLEDGHNIDFTDVDPNVYILTFTPNTATFPCVDIPVDLVITVNDCSCLSVETSSFDDLCNSAGSHVLSANQVTDEPGSWSVDPVIDISSGIFNADGIDPGVYTLTFTIDNQLPGCPDSSVQTITVYAPKFAGIPRDTAFCEGTDDVFNLFDLLTNEDPGGNWSINKPSSGFDAAAATFDLTGQTKETYSFTYEFDNVLPCTKTAATVVIIIDELPTAEAGNSLNIDCLNKTAVLDGSDSSSGNHSYQWLDEDGNEIVGATSITYSTTNPGDYTLVVTNTSTLCQSSDDVTVTISNDLPTITLKFTPVTCNGKNDGTIEIDEKSGGDGNYTFKLDNGAFSTEESWTNIGPGSHTVYILDGNGCDNSTEVLIEEPAVLDIKINTTAQVVEVGTDAILSLESNVDLSTVDIVWTTIDGEVCSTFIGDECTSLTVTPEVTTEYCVTITDENGCTAEDCITLQTNKQYDVYIPWTFNPEHNSGDISKFYISDDGGVINITKFQIYSRWGERLFETDNILPGVPNDGWDGKYKGKFVNPGVYVYLVEVVYDNDSIETFTGTLTVIR